MSTVQQVSGLDSDLELVGKQEERMRLGGCKDQSELEFKLAVRFHC